MLSTTINPEQTVLQTGYTITALRSVHNLGSHTVDDPTTVMSVNCHRQTVYSFADQDPIFNSSGLIIRR